MEASARQSAEQLRWWLKLPPTNLIARADHFRFQYALYLITHQVATVLYGLNRRPITVGYPSRLRNAQDRLNHLPIAPVTSGDRLLAMVGADDQRLAWAIASELIAETLRLAGNGLYTAPTVTCETPRLAVGTSSLRRHAEVIALQLSGLPGAVAVAVSGSLSRGLADERSDIDLCVFCQMNITEKNRYERLSCFPGTRDLLIEPACDTLWSGGALVHIRYWPVSAVTDLMSRFPVPPEDPHLAEELQLCQPVHDPFNRLSDWQTRLRTLPKPLIGAIYDKGFHRRKVFAHCWAEASSDADLIRLYCLSNQMVNDWLAALFAINDRFLSTPRWTHQEWARLPLRPDGAEERLAVVSGPLSSLDKSATRLGKMDALWDSLNGWRPSESFSGI